MPLRRPTLTGKLLLLVSSAILLVVMALGYYFDGFLRENFLANTEQRMLHGYQRVHYNLGTIQRKLEESIAVFTTDQGVLASVELINNYQDKQNYNRFLIDEEKKSIAAELLNRVKFAFNDQIAAYDRHDELIAYVIREAAGYRLHFISYEGGQPVLYSRLEQEGGYRREAQYRLHPLIPFQHQQMPQDERNNRESWSEYILSDGGIVMRAHQALSDTRNGELLGNFELSNILDEEYFRNLSQELGIAIRPSTEALHHDYATSLAQLGNAPLQIHQTETAYLSAVRIDTRDASVYLVATLDKDRLLATLRDNRVQLLLLLALLTLGVLLATRMLFQQSLVHPLDRLMRQIEKIGRRDYSPSPLVKTGDELETISTSIAQLAHTVEERERSLHASQRELKYLSDHDPLTDLPNRRYFNQRLQQVLDLDPVQEVMAAVLFLDLDEFKNINDTLGHDVGDELLQAVSRRLAENLRPGDTLARIGGDEFNILVEHPGEIADLSAHIEQILRLFRPPFQCHGRDITTTASIGIAVYPRDGEDSITLTKHADLAMYQAKRAGRNGYAYFSRELATELHWRTRTTAALEAAIIAGDQFTLVYQPKISMLDSRVAGVEALIRWNSPELGSMPPDEFIQLAEETGLIIPIGRWVINRACSDFVTLHDQGIGLDHLSINLSNMQLQHSNMLNTLEHTLRHTGVAPSQVELEITESYIATDTQEALRTLQEFRTMKIRLAIDDFGTGYSSMSYLQRLPVTRIKIDKSFIDGLPHDAQSVAIVRAIISLARAFKLAVTAEGVENAEQLDFLHNEQCDEIQGYYYAKPLPLDELIQYCRATGTSAKNRDASTDAKEYIRPRGDRLLQ